MSRFHSLSRNAWIAVIVVGLADPGSIVRAGDKFRARGTWVVQLQDTQLDGVRFGHASPGGQFTGVFSGTWINGAGAGVGQLDFGDGDSLTYDWQVRTDEETGLLVGTWVVTGGSGRLTGASGSGTSVATVSGDGTGEFEYVGTLSR